MPGQSEIFKDFATDEFLVGTGWSEPIRERGRSQQVGSTLVGNLH